MPAKKVPGSFPRTVLPPSTDRLGSSGGYIKFMGDFIGGSGLHWQRGSSSPHYIMILAAMLVSIQFCSTTSPGGHSTKQITIYLSL